MPAERVPARFEDCLEASLKQLREARLLRSTGSKLPAGAVDLVGNDSLGLGRDSDLARQFLERLLSSGEVRFGSGASRVLGGTAGAFDRLEARLGAMLGRPGGVLLMQSGWHANSGVLPALAKAAPGRTAFVADREIHASMIDGIQMLRGQGVRVERFRHNDPEHLEHFVEKLGRDHDVVWIALESLYSMSGDDAPLAAAAAVKARHPSARIILDEAHAFGAWGPEGLGIAAETGTLSAVDVFIGTFGKAFAGVGSFIAGSPALRAWLASTHRPFIYSTALPPVEAAWIEFLLDQPALLADRRAKLAAAARHFGRRHVVPVAFASVDAMIRAHELLLEEGFAAGAVRPPTVRIPQLRISLSADLGDAQLLRLSGLLQALGGTIPASASSEDSR